jgi:hypothetical protein
LKTKNYHVACRKAAPVIADLLQQLAAARASPGSSPTLTELDLERRQQQLETQYGGSDAPPR